MTGRTAAQEAGQAAGQAGAAQAGTSHAAYLARARFGLLDGLRALAIAAVVFHHAPLRDRIEEVSILFRRGFLGVDFFFVISGFLITTLLLRERDRTGRISLGGFYWRRSLRILPLYLLVVTAVGAYFVFVNPAPGAAERWPFYYLFLANFLVGDIPLLAPTWSLSVEEQYYLIWPALVLLLPVRALMPLLAVLVALNVAGIMGLTGIAAPEAGPLRFALPAATYAPILLGSALALALHGAAGYRRLAAMLGRAWSAPVLAALLLGLLLGLPEDLRGLPNLAIHLTMTALLGALVIREDGPFAPLLGAAPVARIGAISYGIYLLHLIALDAGHRLAALLGAAPDGIVLHLAYIAGSVALAELSFRHFESVFLRLRHKPVGRLGRTGRRAAAGGGRSSGGTGSTRAGMKEGGS